MNMIIVFYITIICSKVNYNPISAHTHKAQCMLLLRVHTTDDENVECLLLANRHCSLNNTECTYQFIDDSKHNNYN